MKPIPGSDMRALSADSGAQANKAMIMAEVWDGSLKLQHTLHRGETLRAHCAHASQPARRTPANTAGAQAAGLSPALRKRSYYRPLDRDRSELSRPMMRLSQLWGSQPQNRHKQLFCSRPKAPVAQWVETQEQTPSTGRPFA